jgi:cell division protein FtsB
MNIKDRCYGYPKAQQELEYLLKCEKEMLKLKAENERLKEYIKRLKK